MPSADKAGHRAHPLKQLRHARVAGLLVGHTVGRTGALDASEDDLAAALAAARGSLLERLAADAGREWTVLRVVHLERVKWYAPKIDNPEYKGEWKQKMMSNPAIMQAMMKPNVMAAMQEVMANPSAAAKYQNDPDFQELFKSFQGMMSG